MIVYRQPDEAAARRLLDGAGLPTADLTPALLEHFLACGPREAPTGVVGLEIHGADALLRSLAVVESERGRGTGHALVAAAEAHARACGVERVYLLTTTAERFFLRLGYARAERGAAPDAIRATGEFSSLCPASAAFLVRTLEPRSPGVRLGALFLFATLLATGRAGSDGDVERAAGRPTRIVDEASGIALVLVPAGEFLMGSPAGEPLRSDDERQHRRVLREAFYLGETEVTVAAFHRFVAATGYETAAERGTR